MSSRDADPRIVTSSPRCDGNAVLAKVVDLDNETRHAVRLRPFPARLLGSSTMVHSSRHLPPLADRLTASASGPP